MMSDPDLRQPRAQAFLPATPQSSAALYGNAVASTATTTCGTATGALTSGVPRAAAYLRQGNIASASP